MVREIRQRIRGKSRRENQFKNSRRPLISLHGANKSNAKKLTGGIPDRLGNHQPDFIVNTGKRYALEIGSGEGLAERVHTSIYTKGREGSQ